MNQGSNQQIAALQKAINESQEAIKEGQQAISKMQNALSKMKGENKIIQLIQDNGQEEKQA